MSDFNPSADFVSGVMKQVRAFEAAQRERWLYGKGFAFSRPALVALFSGGFLLGIINILRMIFVFIFPIPCL